MRNFLTPVAVVCPILFSGAAWAVIQESSLKITDAGKPIPGATIVLTKTVTPKPAHAIHHATVVRHERKVVEHKRPTSKKLAEPRSRKLIVAKGKTDRRGVVLLRFDDAAFGPDESADIAITTSDGRTRHVYNVPIATLLGGGQIDLQTTQGGTPLLSDMPAFPSSSPFVTGAFFTPLSGGYVGLNIGAVVPHASTSWQPNPAGFGFDTGPLGSFSRNSFDSTGFTFGGQVGFDFVPSGSFIVGAVADANFKTNDQTRAGIYASPFGGAFPTQQSFRSNFETTERLRFGVTLPVSPNLTFMPYVTGGLAVAQIDTSDRMSFPTSVTWGSDSQFRPGWTVGAGVGFITASPFRFQVQWLHEDFGQISSLAPNNAFPASFIQTNHRLMEERVTLGVNISLEGMRSYLTTR